MEKSKSCGLHCIKAQNISVSYNKEIALKNVNIHIHCGELTVIIGKNGAGKTTLLKAILGEIKHSGEIKFVDMKDNSTQNLKIGYVPQNINIEKHTPISVYDMITSLNYKTPVWIKKNKKIYEEIKEQLKIFNVENLIDKSIGELSGGELQRVLIAVATMPVPNLLVLDEPVSGIDENGIKAFFDVITKLKKEYDMSIILVSHNLDLVKKYADKVILLDKKIIKEGTPMEVFESKEYKKIFE